MDTATESSRSLKYIDVACYARTRKQRTVSNAHSIFANSIVDYLIFKLSIFDFVYIIVRTFEVSGDCAFSHFTELE
jgi:hypothetical protein